MTVQDGKDVVTEIEVQSQGNAIVTLQSSSMSIVHEHS
jgi:hypothetical protein